MNSSTFAICHDERDKGFLKFVPENFEFFIEPLVLFTILHAHAGLFAILGNALIITAIVKSPALQKPSYLLITSMAFTDLLVGLIYSPMSINRLVLLLNKSIEIICRTKRLTDILDTILPGLCLSMSLLIAIDRYLAITLKQRYTLIITKKKVYTAVTLAFIAVFTTAVIAINIDYFFERRRMFGAMLGISLLCVILVFYVKSFNALYRYKGKINVLHRHPSQNKFRVRKFQKSLITMVIILVWLLVCYAPLLIAQYISFKIGATKISFLGIQVGKVMFVVNSFTNPIIYVVRFTDLRHAILQLLERCR